MAYSHSGKVMATGGADRQVRFWNAAHGRPLPLVLPHAAPVSMVAFVPDDQTILTATEDGEIRLWDAKSGALRAVVGPRAEVAADRGARPGRPLAGDRRRRLVGQDLGCGEPRAGSRRCPIPASSGRSPLALAARPFSRPPLTRSAALGCSSGEGLGPAAYHQQGVSAVAFSADGSRVLTGSDDGVCQFRRSRIADPRCLGAAHRAGVGVVGFSPDGRVAVTATKPYDGTEGDVQLWDVATGRRRQHATHSHMVTAAIFGGERPDPRDGEPRTAPPG